MEKAEEFSVKLERIRRYLAEKRFAGVALSRSDNFAWAGCGADSVVNTASETGVGTLVVSRDSVALVANNIESDRLLAEELEGLPIDEVRTFPWERPGEKDETIAQMAAGGWFASDDGAGGLPAIGDDFARLRYELTAAEVERYRTLGKDLSAAVEAAARSVERAMTEAEVAALLASHCWQKGMNPVVLLVAADERIENWRHPVVKDTPLARCVMLVTCCRRQGLVAAITRLVHFGPIPEELKRRHHAVCRVDAAFMLNTSPGKTAARVFEAGRQAYSDVGFPDEWQLHHQGGAIGYLPREYIATPECTEIVRQNQAFAWNPSIRGTKSEDTMLVTPRGVEMLTAPTEGWPTVSVEIEGRTLERADILVK